jgi:colicin import membrane protein
MDKKASSPTPMLRDPVDGTRTAASMLGFSVIGHILFLAILIFVPGRIPAKYSRPSVMNVSIVSLPTRGTGPAHARAAEVKPEPKPEAPPTVPAPSKPPEIQAAEPREVKPVEAPKVSQPAKSEPSIAPDAISVAPKKKQADSKVSLKKKTFKSDQVVKKAIQRIEKEAEETRPKIVADAIDRLKEKVKTQDAVQPQDPVDRAIDRLRERVESGAGPGFGSGDGGSSGPLSRRALEQIDLYKLEIAYQIEKKWAASEQLTGGRTDLEAVLMIKIMPNGEIQDIWFEKKSGNNYFDDSAYKAVIKSNPLPPLPKEFREPFYNIGLVFTPGGLKKGMG